MGQHVIINAIDWNVEAAEFAKSMNNARDEARFKSNIVELKKLLK